MLNKKYHVSISDLAEELKNNDPEFREAWEEKHGDTKTNG